MTTNIYLPVLLAVGACAARPHATLDLAAASDTLPTMSAAPGGSASSPPTLPERGAMVVSQSAGGASSQAAGGIGGSISGGSGAQAGTTGAGGAPASIAAAGAAAGSTAGAGGVHAPAAVGGAAAQSGSSSVGTILPSAGCMKQTPRPMNGTVTESDHIYKFPTAYDGTTPMPLMLALHAAGNPNTQLQTLTEESRLATDFVRAFPKSTGSAWVLDADAAKVNAVLDDILAEYCIDEHRIFATGHSSGAQMIVQMLCDGEVRFRAVAPVAASKYCSKLPTVPVIYIQGMMDAQRGGGDGEDVVRVFCTSNACESRSSTVASVEHCPSTFDRMDVAPGCISYEGCKVPTLWCSHNDNGYNSTDGRQHGWPCFASDAIAGFFLSLQ